MRRADAPIPATGVRVPAVAATPLSATVQTHLMAAVTSASPGPAPGPPHEGMTWIPGRTFAMGSKDFYPRSVPSTGSPSMGSGWMRSP